MKKISFLAFILISSTALFAQNEKTTTPATRFGIKAGVNMSKLRPNDVPSGTEISTNMKTSFGGGFFVNIPLGTGGLAFQPEVLFNGQGSKLNMTTTVIGVSSNVKYEQDLRYLSVPMMFQFKSTSGFYGELGPQISYLLDARQDGPGDENIENEKNFEKFEFSGGAGIGYVSNMGLGIGARYNHGFTNVLDNESNSGSNNLSMKHSVIQIGLFYQLGGK